jgi:hypothetical protein
MTGQPPDYRGSPLLPITMPPTLVPRLSQAQYSEDLLCRVRAASKDDAGDDNATSSPASGRWPRVFPGL